MPGLMKQPGFVLKQIGIVLGIFLICTGIDFLRKKTIGKIEHIALLDQLDAKIASLRN